MLFQSSRCTFFFLNRSASSCRTSFRMPISIKDMQNASWILRTVTMFQLSRITVILLQSSSYKLPICRYNIVGANRVKMSSPIHKTKSSTMCHVIITQCQIDLNTMAYYRIIHHQPNTYLYTIAHFQDRQRVVFHHSFCCCSLSLPVRPLSVFTCASTHVERRLHRHYTISRLERIIRH